jgi:hypothetical protein
LKGDSVISIEVGSPLCTSVPPRVNAAQRLGAIGPTTRSFGAPRLPSQPRTFDEVGSVKLATCAPVASVKVVTAPATDTSGAGAGGFAPPAQG